MARRTKGKKRSKSRSGVGERRRVTCTVDSALGGETVYKVAKGTVLFNGGTRRKYKCMFTTPHMSLARMYAGESDDGAVFTYVTTSELRLISKESIPWALKKGKVDKGEWDGFGSSIADAGFAVAFCRQRGKDSSWLQGYDGWIYKFSNRTLGEIMLCDDSKLELMQTKYVTGVNDTA